MKKFSVSVVFLVDILVEKVRADDTAATDGAPNGSSGGVQRGLDADARILQPPNAAVLAIDARVEVEMCLVTLPEMVEEIVVGRHFGLQNTLYYSGMFEECRMNA